MGKKAEERAMTQDAWMHREDWIGLVGYLAELKRENAELRGQLAELRGEAWPEWAPAEIRERRKAKKMSQTKLAELIGVTQATVSHWERERRCPWMSRIRARRGERLGWRLQEILGDEQG